MNDSTLKTFLVAALLCVVCSIVVSAAAVILKPYQQRNALLDKQVNILVAAGLVQPRQHPGKAEVDQLFQKIVPVVIDMKTGQRLENVDPNTVDPVAEADDAMQNIVLDNKQDIARIRRIAKRGVVYMTVDAEGKPIRYVFPIYGKGLWSTMYGFIALENDLNTIAGINFYQHGETPGLGGEIANPAWQKKWEKKDVFAGRASLPTITVMRNGTPNLKNDQIDGIAGSTLTAVGVQNAVRFWLGKSGYGPYIMSIKSPGYKYEDDEPADAGPVADQPAA